MKSIIKEMYNGEISETSNAAPNSWEYILKKNIVLDEAEHWHKKMSEKDYKRFEDKLIDQVFEMNEIEMEF